MTTRLPEIPVFVATRTDDVPAGCARYAAVDGSVPGATATWDHHATGEPINLDAMPDRIAPTAFDGVGTTMADTDAVVAAAVVLLGGKAAVHPDALEALAAASHRCDHLVRHPAVSDEADRIGDELNRYVSGRIAAAPREQVSRVFGELAREIAEAIARGTPLPGLADSSAAEDRLAEELDRAGRIRISGPVGVVDLRGHGKVPPAPIYRRHRRPLGLFVEDHPSGGIRYTVGVNPFVPDAPTDLGPLLWALAAAEFAHGPPALSPDPVAGSENWGGRATVFGSPWNYGSRLEVEVVVGAMKHGLTGATRPDGSPASVA